MEKHRYVKPIHTKFCKLCGNEFLPSYSGSLYCSTACRDAARVQSLQQFDPIECRKCHKTFVPKQCNQRLCPECIFEHHGGKYRKSKQGIDRKAEKLGMAVQTCSVCGKQRIVGPESVVENFVCEKCERKELRKRELDERGVFVCPICKKEFKPKRRSAIYCSDECRKVYFKQYQKERVAQRSKERARRHFKETRNCEFCGTPFTFDSYLHNKRFCSNTCKRKAESLARRGMVRIDNRHIAISENRPHDLDALREERGPNYFEALFALSESDQIAEIESWTPEIHAECLEFIGSECIIPHDEEEVASAIGIVPQREPEVEDEEDHTNG